MSFWKRQLNNRVQKVHIQHSPQSQNLKSLLKQKNIGGSLLLESFSLRKLEPVEFKQKKRVQLAKNYQTILLQRKRKKLDDLNYPKICLKLPTKTQPKNNQIKTLRFQDRIKKRCNTQNLSYYELLHEREVQQDNRRLIILKQVIYENIKRKSLQMRKLSIKKLKVQL